MGPSAHTLTYFQPALRLLLLCNLCAIFIPTVYGQFAIVPSGEEQVVDYGKLACSVSKYCSPAREQEETRKIPGWDTVFLRSAPQCSCAPICNLYGECCADVHIDGVQRIEPSLLSCQKRYLMISHCPADYEDGLIKDLCEQSNDLPESQDALNTPATSSETDRSYSNIFCGQCNGELPSDLRVWSYTYTCLEGDGTIPVETAFVPRPHPDSVISTTTTTTTTTPAPINCRHSTIVPVSSGKLVKCKLNDYIRTCPAGITGELRRNCTDSPAHKVRETGGVQTFKNGYCAQCNGVDDFFCINRPDTLPGIAFPRPLPGQILFQLLVTPSGNCKRGGSVIPCPVSTIGFCPPGQYYNRRGGSCHSLCSSGELYSENRGCYEPDCLLQQETEFSMHYNPYVAVYRSAHLRVPANESAQFCLRCALIPTENNMNSSALVVTQGNVRGHFYMDEKNNSFICSSAHEELSSASIIGVHGAVVLFAPNSGGTVAYHNSSVEHRNGTFFLNLSAANDGVRCRFVSIPETAVVQTGNDSITIRENLGEAVYKTPFFLINSVGDYSICVPDTSASAEECIFISSSSKRNHSTRGFVTVDEAGGKSRVYLPGYFKVTPEDELLLCEQRKVSWLHAYENTINHISIILSKIGLFVLIVLYSFVRALQNTAGIVIINQAVSFFMAFLCFALTSYAQSNQTACLVIAVATHYFFITAFVFAMLYAAVLHRVIASSQSLSSTSTKTPVFVSIAGWVIGGILIGAANIVHEYAAEVGPMYAQPGGVCFINSLKGLQYYFHVPLIVILLINTCILLHIIVHLAKSYWRVRRGNSSSTKDKEQIITILTIAAKLQISFGLLWVIGAIAVFTQNIIAISLFTIVNSLQGFFLFIVFVCNARVISKVKSHYYSSVAQSSTRRTKSSSVAVEMSVSSARTR